jgi:hypothetical protein
MQISELRRGLDHHRGRRQDKIRVKEPDDRIASSGDER